MKALFAKLDAMTLVAADEDSQRILAGIKVGEGLYLEYRRARNIGFHRKFFSLLRLAYDAWDPGTEHHKSFDGFRDDLLILAGHYDASYGLDGSVKLRAKSISFAALDEAEFCMVYESCFDVIWDRIMQGAGYQDRAEVERTVNQLMGYL